MKGLKSTFSRIASKISSSGGESILNETHTPSDNLWTSGCTADQSNGAELEQPIDEQCVDRLFSQDNHIGFSIRSTSLADSLLGPSCRDLGNESDEGAQISPLPPLKNDMPHFRELKENSSTHLLSYVDRETLNCHVDISMAPTSNSPREQNDLSLNLVPVPVSPSVSHETDVFFEISSSGEDAIARGQWSPTQSDESSKFQGGSKEPVVNSITGSDIAYNNSAPEKPHISSCGPRLFESSLEQIQTFSSIQLQLTTALPGVIKNAFLTVLPSLVPLGVSRLELLRLACPTATGPEDSFKEEPIFMNDFTECGSSILGLYVVGFHHVHGPMIEFSWPHTTAQNSYLSTLSSDAVSSDRDESSAEASVTGHPFFSNDVLDRIPFLALPDASHHEESGFTYFILPLIGGRYIFGVSCYRQISVDQLEFRDADMTRTHVQKSICILSLLPFFGSIKFRLDPVTHAYFNQGDFRNVSLLTSFYDQLRQSSDYQNAPYSQYFFNLEGGLKPLIYTLKPRDILILFKALLLELRIVIYSVSAARASTAVLVLLSLLPGQLRFGIQTTKVSRETSQRWKKFGFPLSVFKKNAVIYPHMSLQMSDGVLLKNSYLVGVTNKVFLHRPLLQPDVIDECRVDIVRRELLPALTLTDYDTRFLKHKLARLVKPFSQRPNSFLSTISSHRDFSLLSSKNSMVSKEMHHDDEMSKQRSKQLDKAGVICIDSVSDEDTKRSCGSKKGKTKSVFRIPWRSLSQNSLSNLNYTKTLDLTSNKEVQDNYNEVSSTSGPPDESSPGHETSNGSINRLTSLTGEVEFSLNGIDEHEPDLGDGNEEKYKGSKSSRSFFPQLVSQWWHKSSASGSKSLGTINVEQTSNRIVSRASSKFSKEPSNSGVTKYEERSFSQASRSLKNSMVIPRLPKGFFDSNLYEPSEASDGESANSKPGSERNSEKDTQDRTGKEPHHESSSKSIKNEPSYPLRSVACHSSEYIRASFDMTDVLDIARDEFRNYLETFLRLIAFAAGPERTLGTLRRATEDKILGLKEFGLEFIKKWSGTENCTVWLKRHRLSIMPKFHRPPRLGWAQYVYPNGDEYVGQFCQGLRHGKGVYICTNGTKFSGQWWMDQRHGEGVLIHDRTRSMYTGQWVGDKKHGTGQLLSCNECYWGSFAQNRFNGKGFYIDSNGNRYEGCFLDGRLHGAGKLRRANGELSNGEWRHGKLYGIGNKLYRDGRNYSGYFVSNLPDGNGVMLYPDGTKFEGNWRAGKRDGEGTLTVPVGVFPGAYRSGGWDDHGRKLMELNITSQNVMVIEGAWRDDIPSSTTRWSITFPTLDEYSGDLSINVEDSTLAPYYLIEPVIYDPELTNVESFKSDEVQLEVGNLDRQHLELSIQGIEGRNSFVSSQNKDSLRTSSIRRRSSSLSASTRLKNNLVLIGNERNGPPLVLPCGKGISKKASTGEVYTGQWLDGMQFGSGECGWRNGGRYRGDWAYGLHHGRGTRVWSDGRVGSGFFNAGVFELTAEAIQTIALSTLADEGEMEAELAMPKKPEAFQLSNQPHLWVRFTAFFDWPIDTSPYFFSSAVPAAVKRHISRYRTSLLNHEHCFVSSPSSASPKGSISRSNSICRDTSVKLHNLQALKLLSQYNEMCLSRTSSSSLNGRSASAESCSSPLETINSSTASFSVIYNNMSSSPIKPSKQALERTPSATQQPPKNAEPIHDLLQLSSSCEIEFGGDNSYNIHRPTLNHQYTSEGSTNDPDTVKMLGVLQSRHASFEPDLEVVVFDNATSANPSSDAANEFCFKTILSDVSSSQEPEDDVSVSNQYPVERTNQEVPGSSLLTHSVNSDVQIDLMNLCDPLPLCRRVNSKGDYNDDGLSKLSANDHRSTSNLFDLENNKTAPSLSLATVDDGGLLFAELTNHNTPQQLDHGVHFSSNIDCGTLNMAERHFFTPVHCTASTVNKPGVRTNSDIIGMAFEQCKPLKIVESSELSSITTNQLNDEN